MKQIISVIGQSDSNSQQEASAYELGELLSKAGYAVVCGGGGGVMAAVARGVTENAGLCIGLLPGFDQEAGNPYLTVGLPTGLGHARNLLVARAGQVVIAIGGAYGTLSEIAFALTMGKVVIGLDTWSAESHNGIPADIIAVKSPQEAVGHVEKIMNIPEGGRHSGSA